MIPGDYRWMRPGEIHGGIDPIAVHREMMRKTISRTSGKGEAA